MQESNMEKIPRKLADNKEVVLKMYDDGWGKGCLEAFDQAWASTHVLHWNEQTPTQQTRTL